MCFSPRNSWETGDIIIHCLLGQLHLSSWNTRGSCLTLPHSSLLPSSLVLKFIPCRLLRIPRQCTLSIKNVTQNTRVNVFVTVTCRTILESCFLIIFLPICGQFMGKNLRAIHGIKSLTFTITLSRSHHYIWFNFNFLITAFLKLGAML